MLNTVVDGTCGDLASSSYAISSLPYNATTANSLCHYASSTAFSPVNVEPVDPAYIDASSNILHTDPATDPSPHWYWMCDGMGTGAAKSPLCTTPYSAGAQAGVCTNAVQFTTTDLSTLSGALAGCSLNGSCPGLCSTGTLDSWPVQNGNIWSWYCDGISNGAQSGLCQGINPMTAGACGSAYNETYNLSSAPSSGLCDGNGGYGTVSQSPSADLSSYVWNWQCHGDAGTVDAACTAYIPGHCGSAHTVPTASWPPSGTLCDVGSASPYSFANNTYSWSCQGNPNTPADQCTAPWQAAVDECGSAKNGTYTSSNQLTSSSANLCTSGVSSLQSGSFSIGTGVWNWTCLDNSSGAPSYCSANFTTPSATCGAAQSSGSHYASRNAIQSAGLCSDGSNPSINLSSDRNTWSWVCGSSNACSAPVTITAGACGADNGLGMPNNPTDPNLCSAGAAYPDPPTGSGPWNWTCLGLGGGADSGLCAASLVQACTGTLANNVTKDVVVTNGLPNGCTSLNVHLSWAENDTLGGGSNAQYTVLWQDATGIGSNFTVQTSLPNANPPYQSPCGTALSGTGVTNFLATVSGHSGNNCPTSLSGVSAVGVVN